MMASMLFTAILVILYPTVRDVASSSVDPDLLLRLEKLEREQIQLRESIRQQKEKNEELLRLIEDDVDVQKRLFLDGIDFNTTTHFATRPTPPPCQPSPQVGFHARLTTGSTSLSSGNIRFDLVETNVGDGYNTSTGNFVVPYPGKYEFILTLMSRSGYTFDARIMRDNSTELCRAHASTQKQAMGACVTMVELPLGAVISVRQWSGTELYGGKYTSFSGHIINN